MFPGTEENPEESGADGAAFPWGEEVLEDVRDKVGLVEVYFSFVIQSEDPCHWDLCIDPFIIQKT